MNCNYVGMTMVKKEHGQDYYSSQQSILLTITSLHKTYDKVLLPMHIYQ